MANISTKYQENVPGIFYVDNQCIDCDLCKETAPNNFKRSDQGGFVFVYKQPETPEEESLCMESLMGCPVEAIGNNGDGVDRPLPVRPVSASSEDDEGNDDDRIDCPFCGKMHYPGSKTANSSEWTWDESCVCDHLLFLAIDISAYSGFQYRSRLFNQHLGLTESSDGDVEIPSKDDPEEYLSVSEIIESITLPGLELRAYEDPGGFACGPVGGGTITFGFVPEKANQ